MTVEWSEGIAAIEAEAIAARNAEIAEAVRRLLEADNSGGIDAGDPADAALEGWNDALAAVLAIIERP